MGLAHFLDLEIEKKMLEHAKGSVKNIKSINRYRAEFEFYHNNFSGPLLSGQSEKNIHDQISSLIEPKHKGRGQKNGPSPAGAGAQQQDKGKGKGKKGSKGKGKKGPKGKGKSSKNDKLWQEAFVKGKRSAFGKGPDGKGKGKKAKGKGKGKNEPKGGKKGKGKQSDPWSQLHWR